MKQGKLQQLLDRAAAGEELKTVYGNDYNTIEEKAKLLAKHDIPYIRWWDDKNRTQWLRVAPEDELEALGVLGLIKPKVMNREGIYEELS